MLLGKIVEKSNKHHNLKAHFGVLWKSLQHAGLWYRPGSACNQRAGVARVASAREYPLSKIVHEYWPHNGAKWKGGEWAKIASKSPFRKSHLQESK